MSTRTNKIYKKCEELKLDGFLVNSQSNISYLTGFPSRDSYLLLTNKESFFITDFRYITEAKAAIKGFTVLKVNGSIFELINELCAKLSLRRLGFEAKYLTFGEYEQIKKHSKSGIDLVPNYDLFDSLRQIKSREELTKIKKAIKITHAAFEYARGLIKPGMKESELAICLEAFIKKKGADSFAFDVIVASGPNSALPHYLTSQRKFKSNQPVLLDMGVSVDGYKSDLTRMFFLGKISPTIRRVYDIVIRAQEAAIKQIRPGVPIKKIDYIARQYITQKGFGRYFGHSLGHGVGLDIHEEPHVSSKSSQYLHSGMVFTVEPAIYLANRFGVRIEDMILVTDKGVEVLSDGYDKSIKSWTNNTA